MLYLTGDRHIGDVLDEVVCAADSLDNLYYYHGSKSEFPKPTPAPARTGLPSCPTG